MIGVNKKGLYPNPQAHTNRHARVHLSPPVPVRPPPKPLTLTLARTLAPPCPSLSIVIAESIGWRNTYRIIAGVLITSMVGVAGMSMSDPDLADNLAKPIPQLPAPGASEETGAAEETPPTSTTVSTSTGPDKKPNMGGLDALAAGMHAQLTPFLAGMWVVSVLSDTPLSIVMWWYPSFISSAYPDSDNLYSMYV